jgi:antitoxin (DNA-binding transcriptional repressor) of toxin-antitoxin stability system
MSVREVRLKWPDAERKLAATGEIVITRDSKPVARLLPYGPEQRWVDAALEMFGRVFGGATAYPKAKGIWRDDERGGALVKDEPVVVHCYTTPGDVEDSRNLSELGGFCRTMGRETNQGEVGLVVGDEYFAIRNSAEE